MNSGKDAWGKIIMDSYKESDPWNTSSNAWKKDDDPVVPTINSDSDFNRISSEFNTLNISASLEPNEEDTGFLPADDVVEESIWDDNRNTLGGGGIHRTSSIMTNETVADQNDAENSNSEETETDIYDWSNNIRRTYRPLAADIITIEEIPERAVSYTHLDVYKRQA